MRSVHTPNFPTLLQRLGISLLTTTYQAQQERAQDRMALGLRVTDEAGGR